MTCEAYERKLFLQISLPCSLLSSKTLTKSSNWFPHAKLKQQPVYYTDIPCNTQAHIHTHTPLKQKMYKDKHLLQTCTALLSQLSKNVRL